MHQHQPQFAYAPHTPESAGVLIIAGNTANERRYQIHNNSQHNKSLMNCFRDRTPSHTRSTNKIVKVEPSTGRAEAFILLKEPRSGGANKLALLSASSRNLNRLDDGFVSTPNLASIDMDAKSSFQPFMLNSTVAASPSTKGPFHGSYTEAQQTSKEIVEMKKSIANLENDLAAEKLYSKELEAKISVLTKRVDKLVELQRKQLPEKPSKKTSSNSFRQKSTANGNNSYVQPSKLVTWMNLSNLWKHRPSIETLKEQNIYVGK